MALIKCKMCGGDLEITPGVTVAECEYCGTQQTLPKANDELVQSLFNRANSLRLKCEFDKAERIYEKILQQNDAEAEAHWGIVLCKYGIEYVEDPKTLRRIPTCHRTSYDAVIADPDFRAALAHADTLQRSIYEAEARKIDEIQKNILSIVKSEKPFDVFICYKETDENGRRTPDSAISNDIYHQLTQEGLKVFYAAITLEDKLGQAYEPYIFAALNSAKVMLVIGTMPHYFTSVWVKNEWSRFLKLMKTDRSKLLIPCYKDMDPYELPEEFAHLQAQDMAKIGFINDIVRGIRKVVGKETPVAVPVVPPVVRETVAAVPSVAPLLDRAFLFLEDGDWDSADEYLEKVLDSDPRNAHAYLGKLMAELEVQTQDALADCDTPFDDNANFQKAIRFGDDALKTTLNGYIDQINARNEEKRVFALYTAAVAVMRAAKSEADYRDAARKLSNLGDYRDCRELVSRCAENAVALKNNGILAAAKAKMTGSNISSYKDAIALLATIPGWQDADDLKESCVQTIGQLQEAAEAARQRREMEAEQRRKESQERKKRAKKAAVIILPIICLLLLIAILLPNILPGVSNSGNHSTTTTTTPVMQKCSHEFEAASCTQAKRCKLCGETEGTALEHVLSEATCSAPRTCLLCGETFGESLEHLPAGVTCTEDGTCTHCGAIIPALGHDYGEATCTQASKCARCGETTGESLGHSYSKATCTEAKKCTRCDSYSGSALGHEFDTAGKCIRCSEKRVNAKAGDIIRFGSYEQDNDLTNGAEEIEWYVLDRDGSKVLLYSRYALAAKPYDGLSWSGCSLRKWVNEDFTSAAFSSEEASKIVTTTLTTGNEETSDKVFILSSKEESKYNKYFVNDWGSITVYANSQGSASRWYRQNPNGGFYMITDPEQPTAACFIPSSTGEYAVCPAMWIDLSA